MLPECPAEYVRFAVYCRDTARYTPGAIAQQTGLDPDHIGLISIESDHIVVDVHRNCKQAARERLVEIGGCRLLEDKPLQWFWLRLGVGRNHGLTMRKLRSLLEEAEAQPVGRIHLCNSFTLVGVREDRWQHVLDALADTAVSGVPLRPREAPADESRGEDPRYLSR